MDGSIGSLRRDQCRSCPDSAAPAQVRGSAGVPRDFIDPQYRAENVAPGAKLDGIALPGADYVVRARFNEVIAGLPRERLRMAVVSGGAVAIVDAQANRRPRLSPL